MRSIWLVRHGEAEHNVQEITGGWTDTALTERGLRQVELLSRRLVQEIAGQPVSLGCSNLQRARHSARIIGQALGVTPEIYPQITDLNNGIAAGMTHAEAFQIAIPFQEPVVDWQPYPEAESWRQFFTRISKFMDEFHARQQCTAILVTHAATVHAIIAWWLGLPVESPTHFETHPASLSVLEYNRWEEHSLVRLNDTAHLWGIESS